MDNYTVCKDKLLAFLALVNTVNAAGICAQFIQQLQAGQTLSTSHIIVSLRQIFDEAELNLITLRKLSLNELEALVNSIGPVTSVVEIYILRISVSKQITFDACRALCNKWTGMECVLREVPKAEAWNRLKTIDILERATAQQIKPSALTVRDALNDKRIRCDLGQRIHERNGLSWSNTGYILRKFQSHPSFYSFASKYNISGNDRDKRTSATYERGFRSFLLKQNATNQPAAAAMPLRQQRMGTRQQPLRQCRRNT